MSSYYSEEVDASSVTEVQVKEFEDSQMERNTTDFSQNSIRSKKSRSVLEMSNIEARNFFLEEASYCNFELPPYITFQDVLSNARVAVETWRFSACYNDIPRRYDNLNYLILHNKDGKYAWRPFQLIHPLLYTYLVYELTELLSWESIKGRFEYFFSNPKIECISMPRESCDYEKDKAAQISHWWEKIEQQSISLALSYEYVAHTDISDCYAAIYTHSIAWALHDKEQAKSKQRDDSLVGNMIDGYIQDMMYAQTNGIPQGSVLMDFIAEIILGYADSLLTKAIAKTSIEDYFILRYRDDYRIFVNNPQQCEEILKLLTNILAGLGLKLNPTKTKLTNQVIRDSIKEDKLYWTSNKNIENLWIQKQLMVIHELGMKFPNSGSLIRALYEFSQRVENFKILNEDVLPLISIVSDIAFHNPRAYSVTSKILSQLIILMENEALKLETVKKIANRLNKIPNTGHSQIWLQRITLPFTSHIKYEEKICHLVENENIGLLWNSEWLKKEIKIHMERSRIIDRDKIKNLKEIIQDEEIAIFLSRYAV